MKATIQSIIIHVRSVSMIELTETFISQEQHNHLINKFNFFFSFVRLFIHKKRYIFCCFHHSCHMDYNIVYGVCCIVSQRYTYLKSNHFILIVIITQIIRFLFVVAVDLGWMIFEISKYQKLLLNLFFIPNTKEESC